MDLQQLQYPCVLKTNHHTPIFIWYPLIQKWNDFTYSTSWRTSSHQLKMFNQSIFIPHLKHVEPKTTPIIFQHEVTYPQGTSPMRSILSLGEQSQVSHHRPISRGNKGVGTMTCSYYHQMEHIFQSITRNLPFCKCLMQLVFNCKWHLQLEIRLVA